MLATVLLVALATAFTTALSPNCDFVQHVQANQIFDITSPNYPSSYPRGVQCRWIATCPNGYNLRLDCIEVNLPSSPSCNMDRLLVSTTGDPQLYGASVTCGRNPFYVVSSGTQLSIGLISSNNSPGGYFHCRIYTQPAQPTQPTCRCGERKQNRIVGGQDAEVNEFRMMAALVDGQTSQVVCGAVIIGQNLVLTAAHCVRGRDPNRYAILVGDHDISVGNDTNSAAAYRISSFQVHPQYNPTNYDYDIAIVRTTPAMQFNNQVGPVCLPFKFINFDLTGRKVILLGWGTKFIGGPVATVLQKVTVDVISQATCRSYEAGVTDRQMCTFTPGKDACQFDSGGPVLYVDPSTGLLHVVGLVSYGRSCASGSPGVNTKITHMLDWIEYQTQANFCRA